MDSNPNRSDASRQPAIRLSQNAYARRIGVNPGTVNRWIKQGRISIGDDRLIDPELADRERSATESPMPHHQARKAQFDEARAQRLTVRAPEVGQKSTSEEIGKALKLETYRLQKAKAEQANLELDRAAGLLVERSEVDFMLRDLALTLQASLEGMAAQLAPSLSANRGDVNALQAEIEAFARDLLAALAAHAERKAREHLGTVAQAGPNE